MASGFSYPENHTDIEWAEHGAVGDLETGRHFKKIQEVPTKTIVDETDPDNVYVGETKPGISTSEAYWRIKKISVTGSITTVTFADGDDLFDNIWDDRANYTYN